MHSAPRRYYLPPLLAATILMGGIVGYGWGYFSVMLEQQGFTGAEIGLAGTVQLTAAIILTLVFHRFLWKANVFHLQVTVAMIGAASFLMLGHGDLPFGVHVLLRFFFGCGISGTFMIFEYWLNSLASTQHRGKTLALYSTSVVLGMSSGTVLVPVMLAHPFLAHSLPALLFVGVVGVVSSIRSLAPLPHEAPPAASPWGIILLSPTPVIVALLFGITESSYWSFMSVFGMKEGLSVEDATLMLSLISAGGMVMQLPMGWLADRFSPRLAILLATGAGAMGGLLLIPLVKAGGAPLFIHMFLWGGIITTIYTICVILIGNEHRGAMLANATLCFQMMYGFGNIIGPTVTGHALDTFGSAAIPSVISLACATSFVFTAARMVQRKVS